MIASFRKFRVKRWTFFMLEIGRGYFFFQAEDGIRDDLVTGVQTCALPIFARVASFMLLAAPRLSLLHGASIVSASGVIDQAVDCMLRRRHRTQFNSTNRTNRVSRESAAPAVTVTGIG